MSHKKGADAGVFTSFGRALDESLEMAMSARSGELDRAKFEAWWRSRGAEARGMMASLRERAPDLRGPVESMLEVGKELVKDGMTSAPARGRRRRSPRRAHAARR